MKTCDEMMNSLLERREAYLAAQKKKKTVLLSVTSTLCVASLMGVVLWQSGWMTPPAVTNEDKMITGEDKVTTTDAPVEEKLLISADEPDRSGEKVVDSGMLETDDEKKEDACTPLLKQTMEQHRGENVAFSVIVQVFAPYVDYNGGYFETNEEMIQLSEAHWKAYRKYVWDALEDRSHLFTVPDPEGLANYYAAREKYVNKRDELYGDIDKIADDAIRIREQKERAWLAFIDAEVEWRRCYSTEGVSEEERAAAVEAMHRTEEEANAAHDVWQGSLGASREAYYISAKNQRFEALVALCETPPVEFSSGNVQGYYVELTADQINTLIESGGYRFRLAMANGVDEFPTNYDEPVDDDFNEEIVVNQ